jgi:putative DNA modification/repair radical SAM protein
MNSSKISLLTEGVGFEQEEALENVKYKVKHLGMATKYDSCCSSASRRVVTSNDRIGDAACGGICKSFTPDGRCISLFKTLYTNSCKADCKYCSNSTSCKKKQEKLSYEPEELCKVFMSLYVRNYVEGLFLSSGLAGDQNAVMHKMVDTIKLLRTKFQFQGYIHLKALPGSDYSLLKEASGMVDRISVNVEAPNKDRLSDLSSVKDYKIDILRRQRWLKNMKLSSGHTTQFVVGATDETDLEILNMMNFEYQNFNLKRAYFSAFSPCKDTPLENKEKTSLLRENRLYNADWLLRVYKYEISELKDIINDQGFLPKEDPKVVYARKYFDKAVDLNDASYADLLRVPGIGITSAKRIYRMQKSRIKIEKRAQLKNIGIVLKRAEPFLKIDGWNQKRLGDYVAV